MTSLDELERAHALHSAGALSADEFEHQKKTILTAAGMNFDAPNTEVGKGASRYRSTLLALAGLAIITLFAVFRSNDFFGGSRASAIVQASKLPANSQDAGVLPEVAPHTPVTPQASTTTANDWHIVKEDRPKGINLSLPDSDFLDFPATLMTGRFREPKGFREYRTRLKDAETDGVKFAGHYAVADIGCGTGCTSLFAIDGKTGKVMEMPFSGEAYSQGLVQYGALSTLVKGFWDADDQGMCKFSAYNLKNERFVKVHEDSQKVQCPPDISR